MDQDDFVPEVQPLSVQPEILPQVSSDEVREKVIHLRNDICQNYAELCKLLNYIQKKEIFRHWGYPTFREYASKELEFKATKALYLSSIWNHFKSDEELFQVIMKELGWSKAKELVKLTPYIALSERDQWNEWIEKAKHLSVDDLIKEIRIFKNQFLSDDAKETVDHADETSHEHEDYKVISLSFETQSYQAFCQAVDLIKGDHPEMSVSEALTAICQDFLGSADASRGSSQVLKMILSLSEKFQFSEIKEIAEKMIQGEEVL